MPDDSPILPVRLPQVPRGAQLARGAVVIDRPSLGVGRHRADAKGYTHVFIVDATVGGTPRQVTIGQLQPHRRRRGPPTARSIFVSGIRKPDAEYLRRRLRDLRRRPRDARAITPLTDRNGPDCEPRGLAGRAMDRVHRATTSKNFTSHLSSLYLMDATGGRKRLWVGNLPSSPSNVAWAPDGSGVYYSMQEAGEENT